MCKRKTEEKRAKWRDRIRAIPPDVRLDIHGGSCCRTRVRRHEGAADAHLDILQDTRALRTGHSDGPLHMHSVWTSTFGVGRQSIRCQSKANVLCTPVAMFPSLSELGLHACQWRVLQFGNLLLQVGRCNIKALLKSDV